MFYEDTQRPVEISSSANSCLVQPINGALHMDRVGVLGQVMLIVVMVVVMEEGEGEEPG